MWPFIKDGQVDPGKAIFNVFSGVSNHASMHLLIASQFYQLMEHGCMESIVEHY
jgi:hypothetical protein